MRIYVSIDVYRYATANSCIGAMIGVFMFVAIHWIVSVYKCMYLVINWCTRSYTRLPMHERMRVCGCVCARAHAPLGMRMYARVRARVYVCRCARVCLR